MAQTPAGVRSIRHSLAAMDENGAISTSGFDRNSLYPKYEITMAAAKAIASSIANT